MSHVVISVTVQNCSSGEQCLRFECEAAGLQRDERAIVRVMSRLWVQTFLKVDETLKIKR